jgi:hypothetical protein
MSVPPGTEMFQFPGFASPHYVFMRRYPIGVGCPIRISTDQSLLAAPHGFSQRATSFIASWRQGIHRMPFSCSKSQPPDRNPETSTMHGNHPRTLAADRTAHMRTVVTHNTQFIVARHPRSFADRALFQTPLNTRHATAGGHPLKGWTIRSDLRSHRGTPVLSEDNTDVARAQRRTRT